MHGPIREAYSPTVTLDMIKDNNQTLFAKKSVKVLSITQIVLGVISILSEFILIIIIFATHSKYYNPYFGLIKYSSTGIICGIIFLVAGILGLKAIRKPTTYIINVFMTLSILSAIFSGVQIIVSSLKLLGTFAGDVTDYVVVGYEFKDNYPIYGLPASHFAKLGLFGIMIAAALTQFVVSIISSSICCRANKCCCSGGGSGQVVYQQMDNIGDQSQTI